MESRETHIATRVVRPRAIIFDLDGTLIDSRNQISDAIQITRANFGLAPAARGQLDSWFGMKPELFFLDLPKALRPTAIHEFRRELSLSNIEAPPFPEVNRVLNILLEIGVSLAVATTKPSWLASHVLKEAKLSSFFLHVQGTDDFPAKPAPDVLLACLERLGLEKNDPIWGIGDRIEDAQAASAAGITPVGLARKGAVLHSREFHRSGALATVKNLAGLLTLIEERRS